MGFVQRLGTELRKGFDRVNGNGATVQAAQSNVASLQLGRQQAYTLRDQLLAGTAFLPDTLKGSASVLLELIGRKDANTKKNQIIGYYNPVPSIVECYTNTLAGRFGQEITLDEEVGTPAVTKKALKQLWRWSNLDTRKDSICRLAANQGTVGIRVVYQPSATAAGSRIFLQFDRPQDIADVEFDSRGNVSAVLIRRTGYYSPRLGDPEVPVRVEEWITRDGFSLLYEGKEQLTTEQQQNPLGVCPYVLLRHKENEGDAFGRHAYAASEQAIYAINWHLSRLDKATDRNLAEIIFAWGQGKNPEQWALGLTTVLYAQTGDTGPMPGMERLTVDMNYAGVLEAAQHEEDKILERQPELALSTLKLYGNVSGDAMAQALKATETAVLRARALTEDAFIRALQIGLSYGVLYGLWNLGTGQGTADAAARAYDDGQGPENFRFAEREALPLTPLGKVQQANANEAEAQAKAKTAGLLDGIVSRRYQLTEVLGLSDADAKKIMDEQAAVDTLPTEPDGSIPPTTRGQPAAA